MLKIDTEGRSQIRTKNRVRVFKEIVTQKGLSRSQLEKRLGLSAPTVTRIVESLIEDGLVQNKGVVSNKENGRNPIVLQPCSDSFYTVGVHIKKSAMSIFVLDMLFQMQSHKKIDLRQLKTASALETLFLETIQEVLREIGVSKEKILGIGVAARGIVDNKKGVIIRFSEDVFNVKLGRLIEENFGCYWYIENNIMANIECEYALDSGNTSGHLLYFYVDEGVGCAMTNHGKMISGVNFLAGKIAHMKVCDGGKVCSCGKTGHLETYVTSTAIENDYFQMTGITLDLPEICQLGNQGEQTAKQLLDDAIDKISKVILDVVTILNPKTVVLDGAIFTQYHKAIDIIKRYIADNVFVEILGEIEWELHDDKKLNLENVMAKAIIHKALMVEV